MSGGLDGGCSVNPSFKICRKHDDIDAFARYETVHMLIVVFVFILLAASVIATDATRHGSIGTQVGDDRVG